MTNLPEWALPIRDEMAEEIDKWIGDMSTSPDIATAALAVALPLIAEHFAAICDEIERQDNEGGGQTFPHQIAAALRNDIEP